MPLLILLRLLLMLLMRLMVLVLLLLPPQRLLLMWLRLLRAPCLGATAVALRPTKRTRLNCLTPRHRDTPFCASIRCRSAILSGNRRLRETRVDRRVRVGSHARRLLECLAI